MIRHRQVEAFAAIVRTGSTVAAARSLNTSQPTVSRLLAQLRDQVGFALFNNQSGKLTLTHEGKQFFRDVEQFLMTTEELERRAWQIRNYGNSTLRLVTIPSVNLHLVPDALAAPRAEIENLSFGLVQAEHHETKTVVASGKADFGICNDIVPSDNFHVFGSVDLACMLAVPEGHPLAEKASASAADLVGQSFISLGDNLADYVTDPEAGRIIRESAQNFASFSAPVIALVEAGNGIGIVDPISAGHYAGERVVFLPFEPKVGFPVNIVYKEDTRLSGVAEKLCDGILQSLQRLEAKLRW